MKITRVLQTIPFMVLFVGGLIVVINSFIFMAINHDVGWLVSATSRWLDGEILYKDIQEVNPPLIFFLLSPIIKLQEVFEISVVLSSRIYFLFIITACLFFAYNRLKSLSLSKYEVLYLFLGVFIIVFYIHRAELGQRDQLAIVFLLPYIFSRYFSENDRHNEHQILRGAGGVLAALAVCLKPHLFSIVLAVELWVLCHTKSIKSLFKIEFFTALITVIFFLTYIFTSSEYLSEIIPLANAAYWTYGDPLNSFRWDFIVPAILFSLLLICFLQDLEIKKIALYLWTLSLAALVSFYFQSHYFYQLIPFNTLWGLSFVLILIGYNRGAKLKKMGVWLVLIIVSLLVGLHAKNIFTKNYDEAKVVIENRALPDLSKTNRPKVQLTVDFLNTHFSGEKVYVFSPNVLPSAVVGIYTKSLWAPRLNHTWPLPAIDMMQNYPELVPENKLEKLLSVSNSYIKQVEQDLNPNNVSLIIIDVTEPLQYFDERFSYLNFIQKNEKLNAAFLQYAEIDQDIFFMKERFYKAYINKNHPFYQEK